LKNAFTDTYGGLAPGAYPEVHYVTAPLRAAAWQRGEIDDIHLWGGEAHELAQPIPAGELVRQLVEGAREALAQTLRPAAG
jgi:nitronate monooxygenase